jgi:hypothetical protein
MVEVCLYKQGPVFPKTSLNIYHKLPTQDQLIIKAVTNTQNMRNPTTQAIIKELQKLTNTAVDKAWLIEKLDVAENAGLVKKTVAIHNRV